MSLNRLEPNVSALCVERAQLFVGMRSLLTKYLAITAPHGFRPTTVAFPDSMSAMRPDVRYEMTYFCGSSGLNAPSCTYPDLRCARTLSGVRPQFISVPSGRIG